MRSQYSRIERSEENLPERAVLRIDMRGPALRVAPGGVDAVLAGEVGGVVGEHQERV